MGGFRFNGCGVTDHFKNIKSLGTHICPKCRTLAEFTLDEANQKIDVLWIPTVTLKTRYAVMCKKCENGEFCSVEWAGYLMNQTQRPEIIFESEATAKGWSASALSFKGNQSGVQTAVASNPSANISMQSSPQAQGTKMYCSGCGAKISTDAAFCPKCGKRL